MAIVISGVNNNDKITASDGTIDLLSGVNFNSELTVPSFKVGSNIQLGNVGIITATTFTGNVTGNINNSTLLLQTGGNERLRIDSSGRVLIGTTTEGKVEADDLTIATSGSTGITLRSAAGNAGNIMFSDGTSGDDEMRGTIQYHHLFDEFRFFTNAVKRMIISSAGRVGIGSDNPVAHLDVANYQNIETLRLRDKHFNKYLTIRGGGSPNRMVIDSYEGGGGGAAIDLASNGDTKLRIASNGNVGIGTDNPSQKLDVLGTSNLFGNGGASVQWGDTDYVGHLSFASDGAIVRAASGKALIFHTNHTNERLRITSAGHVNIGAASPTASENGQLNVYITTSSGKAQIVHSAGTGGLRLAGTGSGSGSNLIFSNNYSSGTFSDHWCISHDGGNNILYFKSGGTGGSQRVHIRDHGETQIHRDGNGDVFEYYRAGTSLFVVDNLSNESNTRMRIRNPNGQINYNSSSDYRLKENDVKITDGIIRLKKLRPITFNWKSGTNTYDGFFAHEVSEACPMAVDGTKDQVATADDVSKGYANNVGDPIYQGIDHGKMVPVLTAALQEAIAKIETLETKVSTLEGS